MQSPNHYGLKGGHTHTYAHESNFNKLGTCRHAAG